MFTSRKLRRFGKIILAVVVCYTLIHFSFSRKLNESESNVHDRTNKFMPEEHPSHNIQNAFPQEGETNNLKEHALDVNVVKKIKSAQEVNNALVNIQHSRKPRDDVSLRRNISNGVCPLLLPPSYQSADHVASNVWYTVLKGALHVYSAFLDTRDRTIKVMAVAHGVNSNILCQIWGKEEEKDVLYVTEATWHLIPETHGFRFVPFVISCSLPDRIPISSPRHVSLVQRKCAEPSHVLPVQIRPDPMVPRYNFTVCLTPINRGYDRLGEFLEYMEINGMFGADHFIFYDHQIGDLLLPFIESYKHEDKLTVLPWKIPIEMAQGPTNEIHYFGQVIALNDCMFRARLNSKYVVFLDLDEIIVPMRHENWLDLISDLSGGEPVSKTFIFPNVFFRQEWTVDPTYSKHPLVSGLQLRSLLYTKREYKTWPHRMRSKYMSPSDALWTVGIHYPWRFTKQFSDYTVSEVDGLLFHYRNWEDYKETAFMNQTRMFHFADTILHRVRQRLDKAKTFGYKDIM